MGKNMFGIEEASKYFDTPLKGPDVEALSEVPFADEVFRECKDTHILVAVFPLSVRNIKSRTANRKRSNGEPIIADFPWDTTDRMSFENNVFMYEIGEAKWQLLRKIPASTGTKNGSPNARAMMYVMAGHYLNSGENLFKNTFIYCSNLRFNGQRVYINNHTDLGIILDYDYPHTSDKYVGIEFVCHK
jgi:hypothetical protein